MEPTCTLFDIRVALDGHCAADYLSNLTDKTLRILDKNAYDYAHRAGRVFAPPAAAPVEVEAAAEPSDPNVNAMTNAALKAEVIHLRRRRDTLVRESSKLTTKANSLGKQRKKSRRRSAVLKSRCSSFALRDKERRQ